MREHAGLSLFRDLACLIARPQNPGRPNAQARVHGRTFGA